MRPAVRFRFCFAAVCCALWAGPVAALENSVIVESKTVVAGTDSVRVGIFVSNTESILYFCLPLELRSVTPGAFVHTHSDLSMNPIGRLRNSPLGDGICCFCPPWPNPLVETYPAPDSLNDCSGPVSSSYGENPIDNPALVSPDAYYFEAYDPCGPLYPGQDLLVLDSASCQLIFDVTTSPGEFEIDTCCVTHNHLWFGDGVNNITPRFVKGTITIAACDCSCHADPQCDGVTDIVDVIRAIDRAFRGADGTYDATCRGYGSSVDGRTDVDCSGATDILDVVKLIDVSMRGGKPALLFCSPCAASPASSH